MKAFVATTATVALMLIGTSVFAEECKSGLQAGDAAGFYTVKDCTGPAKGTTLCYR